MKFAIIAAGEGSRLQHEGVNLPKPLVNIHGEAMIDRLMRIFRENGAHEIVVIVNTLNPQTEQHILQLKQEGKADDVKMVVKSTPSSMHSFAELAPYLKDDMFCLTTVDTIFKEEDFKAYINYFKQSNFDGCMAVTDYVDDEKPLYVATDDDMNIKGFHDKNEGDKYISGGIYCLHPNALQTLDRCLKEGKSRMRNFQRALVEDIAKAEQFLSNK